MAEWAYTVVVPALVLRDSPGEPQSARIDFEQPLDLGNNFCIEFWFKSSRYPLGGETSVLRANLSSKDSAPGADASRELVLRQRKGSFTPEFQNNPGPEGTILPPLNQWIHIAVVYQQGKLEIIKRYQDGTEYERSVALKDEAYRLISLALASEDGATHQFADLRLWRPSPAIASLRDRRQWLVDASDPNLIGYWKLDEGSGTLMVDFHGNDGLIEGGGYVLDSGLTLQPGSVVDLSSYRNSSGRRVLPADSPPRWKDPSPAVIQNRYLDLLEQRMNRDQYMAYMSAALSAPALENQCKTARDELVAKRAELDQKKSLIEKARETMEEEVGRRHQEIQQEQQDIVKAIESSQKIHVKDFILQLQDDLTRSRERIRKEYGRVYGLDTVSMEVKVLPGVGGIGLHLPDPGLRIDPGRLSTLKLRFRAAPAEEEGEPKWVAVPQVEGSTEDFARRKLSQAGFRVDVVFQEVVDATREGRVLAQIYKAKDGQAELGGVITLIIGQRQ